MTTTVRSDRITMASRAAAFITVGLILAAISVKVAHANIGCDYLSQQDTACDGCALYTDVADRLNTYGRMDGDIYIYDDIYIYIVVTSG